MRLRGPLFEPQINVPVWRKPSAGVGDTRPFAWSEMSARGRRNRSCACCSAGVGDTRPFAWSESARGRRRKRGAAAGAMLGRVWAAGGSGGGSVDIASRSNRQSNSSAGAPACVARACNSAGPPAAQARTCSAALRQGEGCVAGGAMVRQKKKQDDPSSQCAQRYPKAKPPPRQAPGAPACRGLARRLRRLEPRGPTPPCRWGAVGPGSARPGKLPARPS